jgi:anti-sigma B factor antagonist
MTARTGAHGGFTVRTAAAPPWIVTSLHGELDIATAPVLEAEVAKLIAEAERPRLALDLSSLDFCDSSGLSVFVATLGKIRRADGELVLLAPSRFLTGVLERTGLTKLFTVAHELDTANGGTGA